MRVRQKLLVELVAHARDAAPNECCGFLGGRDGQVTSIYRAHNFHASPILGFELGSPEVLLGAMVTAGEDLVAIYHSHTRSEARPSRSDIEGAGAWPDPLWVICSLLDPKRPDIRAYSIKDGAAAEVPLEAH